MPTKTPGATLRQLVKLSKSKEALMAQIQEIDRQMLRVQKKFGIPQRDEEAGAVHVSNLVSRRKRARR